VKTMTYPGGEAVTTVYNSQGLPETLTGSAAYVDGADYTALGQVDKLTLGGSLLNLQVEYDYYSDDQRLYRLRVGTSTSLGQWLDLQYAYDNAGNVTQISDQRSGVWQTQTFTYDALDRLTREYTSTPIG